MGDADTFSHFGVPSPFWVVSAHRALVVPDWIEIEESRMKQTAFTLWDPDYRDGLVVRALYTHNVERIDGSFFGVVLGATSKGRGIIFVMERTPLGLIVLSVYFMSEASFLLVLSEPESLPAFCQPVWGP